MGEYGEYQGFFREKVAAVEMPEHDAERQRGEKGEPERGAGQLDLLERLREEEHRVVADEAERIDERVQVRGVGDDHREALDHGTIARRSATSRRSALIASATASRPSASISVLNGVGSFSARKIG